MAKEYRAFHRVVPEYCHRYMYDGIVCDVPITNLLQSEIGMLIPGKSHSWDESRNSRVSIETLDFAQVRTSTCMIGVGSPAGARRGGGDHRPDPAPFPADDGTLSPPAADQHSRQWRTQNGRVGRVWGIATGEAQRPPNDGPGNHRIPLSDAAAQSVDVAGGMGVWNGGQRPSLLRRGAPAKMQTCSATEGRDRRTDAGYGRPQARHRMRPDDRPTLRAVGTFDVCSSAAVNSDLSCFLYRGWLKRPYLHCRADSVA